jgi:putative DNA primase/helicase
VDTKDRDSVKQAVSYWICELGEIDVTFTRSGISALKAFLSQFHDVLRLPYGRTTSKFARRTMFMGSVNDFDFLRDRTGNRRYMPIVVRGMLNWNDAEIDQLWAEAWQQYVRAEQWWPTDAEERILATIADVHMEQTPIEEKLKSLFDWQGSQTRAEGPRVSSTQLWEQCFPTRQPSMNDMKATANAVRRLWRVNGGKFVNGVEYAPRANGHWRVVYRDKGKNFGLVMPKRR